MPAVDAQGSASTEGARTDGALRVAHSLWSAARDWWRSDPVREVRRLTIIPALISFLMLWPALLGLGVFAPTDIVAYDPLIGGTAPGAPRGVGINPLLSDPVDSFIPWRLLARSEIEAGRWPLWNPYNLLGTHLQANLQSQTFSLWNLLWLLMPAVWGLGAVTFVKWMMCGLGMGLLLRRLGLDMAPAIYGSIALQLSAPVVGWLQWPIADGLIWVPWMMWAVLGWLDTRRLQWLAALALFVAGEVTASHIETTFHSLVFVSVFALCGVISYQSSVISYQGAGQPPSTSDAGGAPGTDNRQPITDNRLVAALALLGAGGLGLALGAVQVLPFLEVLPSSYQWALRSVVHVQDVAQPAANWLLWLCGNGFGWPDNYLGPGNWVESNAYVGVITIPLAACGLFRFWIAPQTGSRAQNLGPKVTAACSPRKPYFWAGMLLVSLSMAYGLPPLSILRELPGFNNSFNGRLISVAGPCLIVLAAMGLDDILSLGSKALPNVWAFVSVALGFVGLLLLGKGLRIWDVDTQAVFTYTSSWRVWAAAMVCLCGCIALARLLGWITPRDMAILIVGLLLVDLGKTAWGFNPTATFDTFYPTNQLTRFLASQGPTQRVAIVGNYGTANMLVPLRVPDISAYDATLDNRYVEYVEMMGPKTIHNSNPLYPTHLVLVQPNATLLSALAVPLLVVPVNQDPNSWQPVPARGAVYDMVTKSNDFWVWKNRYARPYVYFASRFRVAPDKATVARSMKAMTLDTVNEAQVEDPGGTFPTDVAATSTGEPASKEEVASLKLESYEPGEIKLSMRLEKKRFLVVSEGSSPGWRAEVDGNPAQLYRTNYLVQGLVVPAGAHRVRLVYDPPSFKWGLAISGTALAIWLGLVGFAFSSAIRRKKGQRAAILDEQQQ